MGAGGRETVGTQRNKDQVHVLVVWVTWFLTTWEGAPWFLPQEGAPWFLPREGDMLTVQFRVLGEGRRR